MERQKHFGLKRAWRTLPGLLCCVAAAAFSQTTEEKKLISGNTEFTFKLLKQLAKERPDASIFISPYSLSSALGIAASGAAGQTKTELDAALGTTGMSGTAAAQAHDAIARAIKAGASNATFSVANAIWHAPNVQLKPDFVSLNQQYYQARLSALDFTDPRASGMVNRWVEEETRGKIKQLVAGPLSGMTGAFLANAIYFKGTWASKFEQKETKNEPFVLSGGQTKTVPMMAKTSEFKYEEANGFQAIRIPYQGESLGMYVFLPATNSNVQTLVNGMTSQNWEQTLLPKFARQRGTLKLPRFRVEHGAEMKGALEALGIKQAFGGAADFSAMSTTPMFISSVIHKAFVEVNEAGTEAAAATGVTMLTKSVRPPDPPPFRMVVDRPFLFLIDYNGMLLFAGIVCDPSA